MTTSDNPHTEYLPYCVVTYWKDRTACGKYDEWTEAVVRGKQFTSPEVRFAAKDGVHLNNTLYIMALAFEAGQHAKAREITKALFLPESR